MRQLVYISTLRRGTSVDAGALLLQSRRNNARDRVTGLLFFDGKRFLQALEGSDVAVDAAFARIQEDQRHHALVVLSNRPIDQREFGEWAMAYARPGEADDSLRRVVQLSAGADDAIRATFEGFAKVRRAA